MSKQNKKITLVDGNSLMFRSYYATAYRGNFMQTKTGIFTNAVYGFCNMINSLIIDDKYVFVAFDAGSETFRHQAYDDYKATRKALPDELRMQIPYVKKFLDLKEIKRAEALEYEADDYIATLAHLAYNDFDEIRIVTGDKDLLQLVNNKVKVCLTKKGVNDLDEYNSENFHDKAGYYPSQVTDYKGLVGDASDNLPGIKGIGDKTAIKLLDEFGTLENIITNKDSLKGKMKQNVEENYEIGLMCKELATLKKDIEIDFGMEDLRLKEYDLEGLREFYRELEFYSFLKKMDTSVISTNFDDTMIIDNPTSDVRDYINEDSYITIEVFGSNYYNGEFLGIGLVNDDFQVFFTREVVLNNKTLIAYLESSLYNKKTYDYKMLYLVLKKNGIEIKNVTFDLLLASYLINPSFAGDDFKKTVDNIKIVDIPYYDNVYGANKKMKIPEVPVYGNYSISKAIVIKSLEDAVLKELREKEVYDLFLIELELSQVLASMELSGLLIDLEKLEVVGIGFENKIKIIEAEVYEIAEEEFNINSPKILAEVLFEKLNLPHGKKNKTGYSTNVDVLEKLAVDFKIARLVLEYRTYAKLVNTYVNGITMVADDEKFIHPLYRQAHTLTGRLSSIEPNIQNMPIRSDEGQVIREIFVSRFDGGKIISADYSQIELRILAHLSGDEKMIEAFNSGVDFHSQTAAVLYEIPLDDVTKDMRRTAKAINFGIIYGMSAWGLSESLGISPLEANIYINKYFDTYRSVKTYLDSLVENVKVDGHTHTILNRRRYIPEAASKNKNLRSFGERTAMNHPMQGSAADIIKIAMNKIQKRLIKEDRMTLMIAQVHDELLFDVPLSEVDEIKRMVKKEMESVIKLKVLLLVDVNVGNNWQLAK